MALEFDQLNNQLKTADSTNANASLTLTPSGTGAVLLNSTGENLILQSNTFNNSWSLSASSLTGSQSDPFGGSTAWLLTADGTTNQHSLTQGTNSTLINNAAYTYSIYAKKGTNNYVQIRFGSAVGAGYGNFDLNLGVVGTVGTSGNTPTSSITFVGNGWYRCSLTLVTNAAAAANMSVYLVSSASAAGAETNTLSTSVYIYGAQLEIGTTANPYIATTSSTVYNAPQLSFSGVAGLGLQSDGSLYVSPAGTGALQAQATTSSTVGGNARGANAVDWQTLRTSASQVASGPYSVIGGGRQNTSTAFYSTVAGGINNSAVGGTAAFVGAGSTNTAGGGDYSGVVGGQLNSAAGYFNFIVGGFTNSGTSSSSVTTQGTSSVTSGSTAVTLSGSNASIKVGQLIIGTGIVNYTYVAAISGTSLTLSQNANATGTPTLSFYTPHGVVVGGGNNQATGSYSFIGGGGDAGTAANRNTASGDWSFVGGGLRNTASSNQYATVVGGTTNTASGYASFIGGGNNNNATFYASVIGGGSYNTANSQFSTVIGGTFGTTRSVTGYQVFSACQNPIAGSAGVSQAALLILATQTTTASATVLTSDGGAAGTTNQVILPNNSAYSFRVTIIAGVTGAGNTSSWILQGAIKRGSNAASTAIVGAVNTTLLAQDSGASTWAVSATADTTNGGLAITVIGAAATTIRWVCKVETTEMTF